MEREARDGGERGEREGGKRDARERGNRERGTKEKVMSAQVEKYHVLCDAKKFNKKIPLIGFMTPMKFKSLIDQ